MDGELLLLLLLLESSVAEFVFVMEAVDDVVVFCNVDELAVVVVLVVLELALETVAADLLTVLAGVGGELEEAGEEEEGRDTWVGSEGRG